MTTEDLEAAREILSHGLDDFKAVQKLQSLQKHIINIQDSDSGKENGECDAKDYFNIENSDWNGIEYDCRDFGLGDDKLKEREKFAVEGKSCAEVNHGSSCEEEWDSDGRPTGERWAPLGAANDNEDNQSLCSYSEYGWYNEGSRCSESERLQQLEEEQEQLNVSLMALTSHFAQVQFRLKQIVDASPTEKETLLKELEEFANRGIPDMREVNNTRKALSQHPEKGLCMGRERQRELICQLKQQLEDLENYAYQTGEAGLPQSLVMERQRVILDQLRGKLNINVDDLDKLSIEDLKGQVDYAIKELVNPLKMKEQLVSQLQTQIVDLERFIEFLQGEIPEVPNSPCKCKNGEESTLGGASNNHTSTRNQKFGAARGKMGSQRKNRSKVMEDQEQLRRDTENVIKRATTLLNMMSFAQFGCGPGSSMPKRNIIKKTPKGNHWGDLRANLEVAIENVIVVASQEIPTDSDYTSDSEETQSVIACSEALTAAVRKNLAPCIRDLMQHGLMPVGQSQSLVPFLSCFPGRASRVTKLMHAWDLILKYYELMKGDQYNKTPARRLSQSFNLEIVGGCAITNKQTLLGTIGSVISTHTPLKRSYDSHFKAFVCAALNQKKLIIWLKLIFRTQTLTENFYQPWAYVSKTGFEDAFRSLEKLNQFKFELPVNLAVRQLQNIKDAF